MTEAQIPLMDLVAQYRTIQSEMDEAIHRVLESGRFILGPDVRGLEQEVAAYLDVRHAVGVASGTDALVMALRALGIGPGDEVIVPAYTFFASVEAVMLVGATPVLVDILPSTYCLDVEQAAENVTAQTKAIMPVHLYGHPVDMDPLHELAQEHSLKIIEDNAQAFGAEYAGRKTGGLGDIGCLSFFPSKNLGGYGDGGMLVTDDDAVVEQVRMLRTHGWQKKYFSLTVGYNSRLDTLQAAILQVKLRHVDGWNEGRRALAARYTERLSGSGVGLPYEAPYATHVYHLYVIRVRERGAMQTHLKDQGIATGIYYPQPPHLTEACRVLGYAEGDFPAAEAASRETLAIPLYPEMDDEQVERVVTALQQAPSQARRVPE